MLALFEKLFKGSKDELNQILENHLINRKKTFVITANPEVFMKIADDKQLTEIALSDVTMITPDGEGVVHATKELGYSLWGKIAGVDTVEKMFSLGNQHQSSLFIYGSKQEVLDQLKNKLMTEYPQLKIAGMMNGYDYQEEDVFNKMLEAQPDIILVALGVPRQEKLIASHLDQFDHGIFIGCGGSLDVLSGSKKRAPKIFIKLKLEWAYRLAKEPKRIKRFYDSNVKFLFEIRKLKKVKK